MSKQMPSIGRVVHYITGLGTHEVALVTRAWGSTCVNLQVFPDDSESGPFKVTSRMQDESLSQPYTWHWPEYVPAIDED